jgi:hypothetical protein
VLLFRKKVNHCGHEGKPHYAKGMCSNCYHRNGRVKKPWKCGHEKLYAAGMCQNCYINDYNRKKREEALRSESQRSAEEVEAHPLPEDGKEVFPPSQ